MRYLPTPLNVLALILVIHALYTVFSDHSGGDGLSTFYVVPAIGLAIVFMVVDYYIQKYVSKYMSVFLIELAIACVLILLPRIYGYVNRANTLTMTETLEKPYCVMIYDVQNAEKVFVKGNRDIPPSGVVFNSKKQGEKARDVYLAGDRIIGHSSFDDQLSCSNKTYDYTAWFLIADKTRNYDEDSLKIEIKQFILSQCEVIAALEANDFKK